MKLVKQKRILKLYVLEYLEDFNAVFLKQKRLFVILYTIILCVKK